MAYLLIGYVFTTILLVLDFSDWNEDPDIMLFFGTICWPFLIILLILLAIGKLIVLIGDKLAIIPVTLVLIIKSLIVRGIK